MTLSPLDQPEFLPFKLDLVGRRVLWLRFDAAQRREAAFLDDRAIPPNAEGGWLPLDALLTHRVPASPPAHAIFHIGHCGSTLLSRLLEAWPQVQGLREPLPLRTLAEAWPTLEEPVSRLSPMQAEQALHALWSRWSQALPPQSRSVVKATSSCNGLIAPLLEGQPGLRAVLLDMPLRAYLATLLKSPASVFDAASAAAERLRYLQYHGVARHLALHQIPLHRQCAMGWLAEQMRFDAIARGHDGDRVIRMDFEALLASPQRELHRVAVHFGLDTERVDEAVASPAWGRYSKAQSHGYGRDDRAHDLALAMQTFADDIADAEAWVAALAAI
ncbi:MULTISPECIES: sulfotransferase [unclassified Lysobacter]|uniref:sulfotransferase n=1 Tax=unclassified Lysobacter TaxID=2635362 RepID=UPI001C2172A7|nr:sulfotransferase [Lysobacter sp. MMG2]MBU8977194.1 sulfotransferase [Lysobacter sp. MMG2]